MRWLDRLLGRKEPDAVDDERDRSELDRLQLRAARIRPRTERLERELRRLERAPWR